MKNKGQEKSLLWNFRRNARRWMSQQEVVSRENTCRGTDRQDKRQIFPPRVGDKKPLQASEHLVPEHSSVQHFRLCTPGFRTQTGPPSPPAQYIHHPASYRSPSCLRHISRSERARGREKSIRHTAEQSAWVTPSWGPPHEAWHSSKADRNKILQVVDNCPKPSVPSQGVDNCPKPSVPPQGVDNCPKPSMPSQGVDNCPKPSVPSHGVDK